MSAEPTPIPGTLVTLPAIDISPNVTEPETLVAAVFGSESEADDADLRMRGQEDASILYAKPVRRGKTRTYSEVRSCVRYLGGSRQLIGARSGSLEALGPSTASATLTRPRPPWRRGRGGCPTVRFS